MDLPRSNRESTINYLYQSLTYYMFGDQPDPDLDHEAHMTERDPRMAMAKKMEADVFARSSNKDEYLQVLREHVMKLKAYARSQVAPRGDSPAAAGAPGGSAGGRPMMRPGGAGAKHGVASGAHASGPLARRPRRLADVPPPRRGPA